VCVHELIYFLFVPHDIPGKSRWTRVLGRKTLKIYSVFILFVYTVYRCPYIHTCQCTDPVPGYILFKPSRTARTQVNIHKQVWYTLTRVVRSTRVLLSTRYTKEHQGTSLLLLLFSASYKPPLLLVLVLVLVLLPHTSTSTS
jgi:hypothetical protein